MRRIAAHGLVLGGAAADHERRADLTGARHSVEGCGATLGRSPRLRTDCIRCDYIPGQPLSVPSRAGRSVGSRASDGPAPCRAVHCHTGTKARPWMMSPAQRRQRDRLVKQNRRLRQVAADVLALARELRHGATDRIMEPSDLERGRQARRGDLPSHRPQPAPRYCMQYATVRFRVHAPTGPTWRVGRAPTRRQGRRPW